MSKIKKLSFIFLAASLLFWSCDHGKLGGADKTDTYYPGDPTFEERLNFLSGIWYSRDPGIGLLDGYRIRKWSELTETDIAKIQTLFPGIVIDILKTYEEDVPQNSDYILFYDDTLYGLDDDSSGGESWGFAYMGLVKAINVFNDNINRGSIIIEYFDETDPNWLWDPDGYAYQNLQRGELPFFGIYYRVLAQNTVQIANAVDLAALYDGKPYFTEKQTLQEAINFNTVENEAEFISWGVVDPFNRKQ